MSLIRQRVRDNRDSVNSALLKIKSNIIISSSFHAREKRYSWRAVSKLQNASVDFTFAGKNGTRRIFPITQSANFFFFFPE